MPAEEPSITEYPWEDATMRRLAVGGIIGTLAAAFVIMFGWKALPCRLNGSAMYAFNILLPPTATFLGMWLATLREPPRHVISLVFRNDCTLSVYARVLLALFLAAVLWGLTVGTNILVVPILLALGYNPHAIAPQGLIEYMVHAEFPPWLHGVALLSSLVLAPFVEELLFRKALPDSLASSGMSLLGAASVSSLVFAMLHFVPWLTPGLFVFGFLQFFIARKFGVLLSMATHSLYNLTTLAIIFAGRHYAP